MDKSCATLSLISPTLIPLDFRAFTDYSISVPASAHALFRAGPRVLVIAFYCNLKPNLIKYVVARVYGVMHDTHYLTPSVII